MLYCEEAGRVETLQQTIDLVEEWMVEVGTDAELRRCLVQYARARGGESMENICIGIPRFRQLAQVQDKIGWRRFMEGIIQRR